MRLIILGLKDKKTGSYLVYDVVGKNKHMPIRSNETKEIDTLSPFPFSNFSSLDTFNENKFEKCYLEVDAELTDSEFSSMKSSGIAYHRFKNRKITLLNEYYDIFQYSLEMLRTFGKNLGTYDLLTWVIHNETKSELEFNAMKKIIFESVSNKENKEYPLDISLDIFTLKYIDYFRELSEKGYNVTFGRYGTSDRHLFENSQMTISNETYFYLLQNVSEIRYSFHKHPLFTPNFYEKYVKGTSAEVELFDAIESLDIIALKDKGFDIDYLYSNIFHSTLIKLNTHFPLYNGDFFKIFSDPAFAPYIKHDSPYDHYCCEACDGYNIYEMYTEEELEGIEVLVDDRLEYVEQLIGRWGDFLSPISFPLFENMPNDILEQFPQHKFFTELLSFRNSN